MLELRGMRAFSLSAAWDADGISFDAQGVFVGGVPLFENAYLDNGHSTLTVRPVAELNDELTTRYRLPIDVSSKLGSLALVAKALNRGDLAMAAIVAVQMQFPNPPFLTKGTETADELMRRALELRCSRLLKASWDPAQHPRAGTPPNPGWFAPIGTEPVTASPVPAAAPRGFWPWQKPEILEGGGGGGVPRGTLELPFPRGLPRFLSPGGSSPKAPRGPSSTPSPATEPQPTLPFPGGLPPKLAPYIPGGKTSGIFQSSNNPDIELQSGYDGPAASIPPETGAFDGVTRSHVEGHAAALMRELGITEGTLYI